MTAPDIAARVSAGVAFLDGADPGWWTTAPPVGHPIDLDALMMDDGDKCILGQRCPLETAQEDIFGRLPYTIWGSYLSGIASLTGRHLDEWAIPLGFQAGYFDPMDESQQRVEYGQLAAEWARVITTRRQL